MSLLSFLGQIGALVCFAVLVVVGTIAAVTITIPHLGAHHHAPSTLGYIAAYTSLLLLSGIAWSFLGGAALAVLEDS